MQLSGYLMTTPIKDKMMTVSNLLFSDIMLKFGFPRILHSDNGTEFKSKLIENLSTKLAIKRTYISHYHPQANGQLESLHRFITDYIQKFSVDHVLNWDQLLPYASAAFNWFPNENTQESPHFFIFHMWPLFTVPGIILQPKLRYLGSEKGMILLDK